MKNNWQIKKIGEVCSVVGGGTPKTGVSEYWDGDLCWVTPKDLGQVDQFEISGTQRKITEEGLKKSSAQKLPIGSVILSSRAPIGYVVINTVPMATNQGCRSFICGFEILNKYLYYFLTFNTQLLNSLGSGSTFLEVSGSRLKEIEIPLPPLQTQKEIVGKLDKKFTKLRKAKRLQEEALLDTEKIISQTLLQIFEEGKQKGWEEKAVEEITEIVTKGTTPKTLGRSFTDAGVPFLKAENIAGGAVNLKLLRTFISNETSDLLNRSKTKSGDVLMTIAGTIGRVGYLPNNSPEMNTNQAVAIIRPKKDIVSSVFLTYALQSPFIQKNIWNGVVKAAIPNFSLTRIKEILVLLPSPQEQQKVLVKLNKLSEKVKTLRELQKSQLEDLKLLEKAYLREAFRGELV
jgi:type I restriction enzyme S subunit